MGLLNNEEILAELSGSSPRQITGVNSSNVVSALRGCSLDLHIGAIFRPGVKSGEPGSASSPRTLSVVLKEGETAIIQTKESFDLELNYAAFVSPVSSISIKGLLMTNPGHVDPGFKGNINVTVINMGREAFNLEPGTRILRSFLYRLDTPATITPPPSRPISQELLDKLSPDFLSVNSRTATVAAAEVNKATWKFQALQLVIPLVAAVITYLLTTFSVSTKFEERIKVLESVNSLERLKTLELNYPTERRLLKVEEELRRRGELDARRVNSSAKSTHKR